MEALGILVILIFLVLVLVLPIVALTKSSSAQREVGELRNKVQDLLAKMAGLQSRLNTLESQNLATRSNLFPTRTQSGTLPSEAPSPALTVVEKTAETKPAEPIPLKPTEPLIPAEAKPELPPPLPPQIVATPAPTATDLRAAKLFPEPPPIPAPSKVPEATRPPALPRPAPPQAKASAPAEIPPKAPALNLEQFLGVKLFAWLGGLALFFGIVFFVKYAFEHDLIPTAVRVAIGFTIGIGLVVAGIFVHRKKQYTVLAQTFCASGVLILYGVTFAAHSLYGLFNAGVTFALMSLITTAAFFIAVRLDALVVAVLGMVGGFLPPPLCATGEDHPMQASSVTLPCSMSACS